MSNVVDGIIIGATGGALTRCGASFLALRRNPTAPRPLAFKNLAFLLIDHLEGLLSCYRVKVRFGVVEALNGNIRTALKRGRGYTNLRYLPLKVQRMAATKTVFVVVRKAA